MWFHRREGGKAGWRESGKAGRRQGGKAARREGGKAASGPLSQADTRHCSWRAPQPRSRWTGRLAALPPCRLSGFTLIELLVVITVLAILASLVSPMVFRNVGDAKVTAARSQMEILGLALDSYRLDNDYYPSSSQGLAALIALPNGDPVPRNWRGPYLKRSVPNDPWGQPYMYRSPASESAGSEGYDLTSLGRDGQPGGTGEDADLRTGDAPRP